MPPTPRRALIPGTARLAVAAGLVVAFGASGLTPVAFAADAPQATPTSHDPLKAAHDKLGSSDAALLAEARATGERSITMMIATAPDDTDAVARQLDAVEGGSVGRTDDRLGYVRATVPTGRAESAIEAAAKLSSVQAIDLRQKIRMAPPPAVTGTAAKGASTRASSGTGPANPAPGRNTPAKNPYNPSHETGAVDFVQKNPEADGRGVTIGVVDTGVDLAHPALRTTTTGQRKIVDWVTSTDPVADGDETWRRMTTGVSGPVFTYGAKTWKAPAGSYRINLFQESATRAGDIAGGAPDGDANRDGDTTDDWGVLYSPGSGTVTVDVNDNRDFTDDKPMKPYRDGHQIGWFGKDKPSTRISERQPFVVQIRKDVPLDPLGTDWTGKKSDYVNIGVVSDSHGTHVAGITAANGLFGGKMNGAAPGAKIVSSRACGFDGFCSTIAMTEGMIDLVANRGVDVVNMSMGALLAVNDGNNARAELYQRLIDQYGVQLVVSGGNSGPGANTAEDPGLDDKVISVAAGVSKETWAANYDSAVKTKYSVFPFSSRGPREDGGFAPTLVAPGSSVNAIPTWMPGMVQGTSWKLPPGYAAYHGTSMASPQAAGATALLLSAAKRRHVDLPPAKLRTALTSTARHIPGLQAYEEGTGLIDVNAAWKAIERGARAHDYTVSAPVDTALDQKLKTPGFGTGIYDREGGLKAGQKKTYPVTITRTSGPDAPLPHTLRLKNNAGDTFSIPGPEWVVLPLNKPVTVQVQAAPTSVGVKTARLEVDDPATVGTDKQILTTVMVSTPAKYVFSASDSVQRNSVKSYVVTVPRGVRKLEVSIGGQKEGGWAFFDAIDPYGLPQKDDDDMIDEAAYANPRAGVWEITVATFSDTEPFDNPYDLKATAYRASFGPEPVTVPQAGIGTTSAVSWRLTNTYAPVDGTLKDGPLGSEKTARPTITEGATRTTTVKVPKGTASLDVAIGGVSDEDADLDLAVYDSNGAQVAQDADADADESVSVPRPAAGTYTIEVTAFTAPTGSTTYDYRDAFFSTTLGSLKVDGSKAVKVGTGASRKVSAHVTPAAVAGKGRRLVGEVRLVNQLGTVVETGTVAIVRVTR